MNDVGPERFKQDMDLLHKSGKVYVGRWPLYPGESGKDYLDRVCKYAALGAIVPAGDEALGNNGFASEKKRSLIGMGCNSLGCGCCAPAHALLPCGSRPCATGLPRRNKLPRPDLFESAPRGVSSSPRISFPLPLVFYFHGSSGGLDFHAFFRPPTGGSIGMALNRAIMLFGSVPLRVAIGLVPLRR